MWNDCYFKGTAGINVAAAEGDLWYSSLLTMGVCTGFEWNHIYTPTHPAYSRPWQVINNVRSRNYSDGSTTLVITWNVSIDGGICPGASGYSNTIGVYDPLPDGQAALRACIQTIAASLPGMYWLIWNEPDDRYQDKVSPAQGAQLFREISNTIRISDSTARLIVGNVVNNYHDNPTHGCPDDAPSYGCGEHWLTQFISEAHALGYTATDAIAGYGFHIYSALSYNAPQGCIPDWEHYHETCHDAPLAANFTQSVATMTNWVATHDPGKEVWLTEINWHPFDQTGFDTQTRRMTQTCSTLASLPIDRYFWFYGGSPWSSTVSYTALFLDDTGALSPSGERYAAPPASGGCPIWK